MKCPGYRLPGKNRSAHRTQMQESWIPSVVIPYDPRMARVCGGAAAALVFCWLESEFLSGEIQPKSELRYTWAQMLEKTGMHPSHFSRAFNAIGVTYFFPAYYRRACLSGAEFWHPDKRRIMFYSLEITERKGMCTLRRNAKAIDDAITHAKFAQVQPQAIATGAKAQAQADAKRLFGLTSCAGLNGDRESSTGDV